MGIWVSVKKPLKRNRLKESKMRQLYRKMNQNLQDTNSVRVRVRVQILEQVLGHFQKRQVLVQIWKYVRVRVRVQICEINRITSL